MRLIDFISRTDILYTTKEQRIGSLTGNIQSKLNNNIYCSTPDIIQEPCNFNPYSNNIIETNGIQQNLLSGEIENIPTSFNSQTTRNTFLDSGSFVEWDLFRNNPNMGTTLNYNNNRVLSFTNSSNVPLQVIETSPPSRLVEKNGIYSIQQNIK